ncbi:MAG: terpene cyclase/mutase family protein [Planctomycetes bacterium]|nr:terpene cyclase/mutase family protein [Planctomycetota bacterium]
MIRSGWIVAIVSAVCVPAMAADPAEREVDDAIVRALRYLSLQQQPSGGWNVDAFGGEATSATSLAVMSFLGAGHTPGEGPYGESINRGVQFVIDHQDANGMLIHRHGHGPMYDHGISTLMLAEASGMVPERQAAATRKALEQAIRLILASQMVAKPPDQRGGWRYTPNTTESDLSVTGWQLMALRAAKDIGCDVPAENIDLAIDYVKRCTPRDGRGFGYQPRNGATPVLTGTGLLALQVCGEEESIEVQRAAEFLQTRPLRFRDSWFNYGVYYTTIAMYKRGGDDWKRARPQLFQELLNHQLPDGSWQSGNQNEANFGRTYCTAMSVLALTVEYEYLPIYQR